MGAGMVGTWPETKLRAGGRAACLQMKWNPSTNVQRCQFCLSDIGKERRHNLVSLGLALNWSGCLEASDKSERASEPFVQFSWRWPEHRIWLMIVRSEYYNELTPDSLSVHVMRRRRRSSSSSCCCSNWVVSGCALDECRVHLRRRSSWRRWLTSGGVRGAAAACCCHWFNWIKGGCRDWRRLRRSPCCLPISPFASSHSSWVHYSSGYKLKLAGCYPCRTDLCLPARSTNSPIKKSIHMWRVVVEYVRWMGGKLCGIILVGPLVTAVSPHGNLPCFKVMPIHPTVIDHASKFWLFSYFHIVNYSPIILSRTIATSCRLKPQATRFFFKSKSPHWPLMLENGCWEENCGE